MGAGSLMGIGRQWSADELQAFESLLNFLKCLSDVLRETKGMLPYVCFCLVASYEQNWQEKIFTSVEAYLLVCFFLVKFFCPFSMLLTCLITNMSFMECFILLTVT